jgi:hypothetical protein
MNNGYNLPFQQTKGDKTPLSVAVAIILDGYNVTLKHLWDIDEINTMLVKIRKTLCFILFKLHHQITTVLIPL